MDKVKELEQAIEKLVNKFYKETGVPIQTIHPIEYKGTHNATAETKIYGYTIEIILK
jgi:hypothetical protein